MISRFFCPVPLAGGTCVDLPEEAAHHATRVLRLRPGAQLVVFNGDGTAWEGTLEAAGSRLRVRLGRQSEVEPEPPCRITLVQALAGGDKMDWVVQKAVELGASAIVPVSAKRSVLKLAGARAEKRVEHWRRIARSACEQCGRNHVPEVAAIVDLDEWLADASGGWVLAPGAPGSLRTRGAPPEALNLLVGPEGGWEDGELAAMALRGITPVGLGPRVLRTETAGVAAIAAIQALWGDF